VRSAVLYRGLLAAVALSGCNLLTGVGSLSSERPEDVDAGVDSGRAVDAAPTPYVHKDASPNDDASIEDPDAAPQVEAGPDSGVKRVFLTSTTVQAGFGGLAGGDLLCSQRAAAASLGGTWRAWLSTNTTNAVTRVTASGPWYLNTGLLAVTRAQLMNPPIARRIDRDENGNIQSGLVWTGTDSSGTFLDDDCADWTSSLPADHAATGDSKVTGDSWTAATPGGCDERHRLYCFEQ